MYIPDRELRREVSVNTEMDEEGRKEGIPLAIVELGVFFLFLSFFPSFMAGVLEEGEGDRWEQEVKQRGSH